MSTAQIAPHWASGPRRRARRSDRIDDIHGLELLAAAVVGHRVAVAIGSKPGVHSDGYGIFVGAGTDVGSLYARSAVIAQATLIAVGSLAPTEMWRLARSTAECSRRYLGLEVVRASVEFDVLLPRTYLSAVAEYAAQVGVSKSPAESLQRALAAGDIAEPPDWFGVLRPRATLTTPRADSGAAPTKAEAEATSPRPMDDDDDDGERSRILEKLTSPLKSPLGAVMQRIFGAKRAGGDDDNSAGGHSTVTNSTRPAGRHVTAVSPVRPKQFEKGEVPNAQGFHYPEWDGGSLRYRQGWCTVRDFDPPPATDIELPRASPSFALLREFVRLGLSPNPCGRQLIGDDLDLTALVDYQIDLATNTSRDLRVYVAPKRKTCALSVFILLDATGSSGELAAGQSLFDEHRTLAHLLTTALDRTGARTATYAFYSRGRDHVRFLRCKSFQDQWMGPAQRRLASIRPQGFTRLGAALRHSAHLLATGAGTRKQLLVVIGDGVAYDDGYEGRYAVNDCRRAVDEARAAAISSVGLSTRSSAQLASIWSPESFRVLASNDQLGGAVREVFAPALRDCARR